MGWVSMAILWWFYARGANPMLRSSAWLSLLYVLSGGLCLGLLLHQLSDYLRSKSVRNTSKCVAGCAVVLAFGIPTPWTLVPMLFPVVMLVKSAVSFPGSDWLDKAARSSPIHCLRQSRPSRPCRVQTPQPLLTAASFTRFPELCEAYARWAVGQGLLSGCEVSSGVATFYLDAVCMFWGTRLGCCGSSWIRLDEDGGCAVYICPEDFRRFRGRSYREMCEQLARTLSDSFCEYLCERIPG
jgi:hypothetical protein